MWVRLKTEEKKGSNKKGPVSIITIFSHKHILCVWLGRVENDKKNMLRSQGERSCINFTSFESKISTRKRGNFMFQCSILIQLCLASSNI